MPNAFQNRFETEPEGDVLFGTNGIRRNPDALKNGLGLSQFAPEAPTAEPEDALFDSMKAQSTPGAIISEPESEMAQVRGEPDPSAVLSAMGIPQDMMKLVMDKLRVAQQNPAFGQAYQQGLAAGQAALRKSGPGLSNLSGR